MNLHVSIPLVRPGSVHSGSACWDNCGWALPDELHANLFSWQLPTQHLNSTVSPLQLHSTITTTRTLTTSTHSSRACTRCLAAVSSSQLVAWESPEWRTPSALFRRACWRCSTSSLPPSTVSTCPRSHTSRLRNVSRWRLIDVWIWDLTCVQVKHRLTVKCNQLSRWKTQDCLLRKCIYSIGTVIVTQLPLITATSQGQSMAPLLCQTPADVCHHHRLPSTLTYYICGQSFLFSTFWDVLSIRNTLKWRWKKQLSWNVL